MAALTGVFLVLCFFAQGWTTQGLGTRFWGPLGYISPEEMNCWLACAVFLFPGLLLIAFGLRRPIGRLQAKAALWLEGADRRNRLTLLFLVSCLCFVAARIGHYLVLLDYPITDDEFGAMLGGQIWASGKLMAPMWTAIDYFKHPFLFIRGQMYTSIEWPAPIALWALGEVTGLGTLVWSAIAAIPAIPVFRIVERRFGPAWGLLAALLLAFDPTFACLSLTTHAHLLAVVFCSLALWAADEAIESNGRFRACFAFGLATGLGVLSRPFEISFVLLPFYLYLAWKIWRRDFPRLSCASGLALGLSGPVLAFLLYNWRTTGGVFDFARFHSAYRVLDFPGYAAMRDQLANPSPTSFALIWSRFAKNLSENLMILAAWFYAPVGFVLAYIGIYSSRRKGQRAGHDALSVCLGLSLLSLLFLALCHDAYGIHSVGPINFSECAPILAVLAAFGLKALSSRIQAMGAALEGAVPAIVLAMLAGAVVFTGYQWRALHRQALIHEWIYGFVSNEVERHSGAAGTQGAHDAVILTQPYHHYWARIPEFAAVGTFTEQWRIPRPDLSEPIIYLNDVAGAEAGLRKVFPHRDFYRLILNPSPPYLELRYLSPT